MRAFVGLPLPEDVIDALVRLQSGLPVGRHVAPENLHLTLAFLDEQTEAALTDLDEELSCISAPLPQIRITGLDLFGGGKVRLLCAVVAPDPALTALHKRVRGAARAAGIDLPRERFRPHVTLVRFRPRKAPGEAEKLADFLTREGGLTLPPFSARQFCLYRSTLMPEGAIYQTLASYPLA